MLTSAPRSPLRPSPTRRLFGGLLAIGVAAAIAAGCGSDDGAGGGEGETGIVGDAGPLAWMPQETWLVSTADLSADRLDTAVETFDRLPIWALAEGFLPASDGEGLRKELLEQVAGSTSGDSKASAKELEDAFGDRLGLAITDNDPEALDSEDDVPVMAWIEVDDEEQALQLARDVFEGSEDEAEHEGYTYFTNKDEDASFLVADDLFVLTTTPDRIEQLIDLREGDTDDTLAGDETAAAVLEAGIGEAMFGAAIATQPLLESAPELVADNGGEVAAAARVQPAPDSDPLLNESPDDETAQEIADQLGPVLESEAIDGAIPDWIGASLTVDEVGLRVRGAWSNPRDLASPEPGSRELLERLPGDVPIVQAGVMSGTELGRVQDAWAEVRDAYDLDLRELATSDCAPEERWACTLGAEVLLTVLEDEALAQATEDTGDVAYASTQDITPALATLANLSDPAAGGGGAGATPEIESRLYEFVSTAMIEGYEAPEELAAAAADAGIVVTASDDLTSINVKVRAGSPAARELATLTAEDTAVLATTGIDLAALTTPAGLTFETEEVDGLYVAGFPFEAASKVGESLAGDSDTIADSQTYQDVVEAADPPNEVGAYGFVDIKTYVEGIVTAIGETEPEAQRIIPTLRNNLSAVPGLLQWSTREAIDGEEVGVYEAVLPVLD